MKLAQELIENSNKLFSKKDQILSHWQDVAINFYPQRADFTQVRTFGEELMQELMTSQPVIACRDLGNAFGTMLRPSQKEWFKIRTNQFHKEDTEAKQWLEWATKTQRNAMYDRKAQFARATKEGDMDFAAFGQAAISTEITRNRDGFVYRCWHLRDMAWCENDYGIIDTIYRRWKPTAQYLVNKFPKTVPAVVREELKKDPYKEYDCIHAVISAEKYESMEGGRKVLQPYVSIYIIKDGAEILEAEGSWTMVYTIPRWQTVSGSQYAYSPATVAALADARLIQAMTRVLLTAGEKAIDPPMIAVSEAIRGDVSIFAGGITYVSEEYDERLGEVLRPLSGDKSGIPLGLEMQQDLRSMIMEAFFLNKLNLPPSGGPDMTAYEVGQRVQEYIRNALPLFEPMEADYNGQLCEATFELGLRNGLFGRVDAIPKSIQGAEIEFMFESPLREATEKIKVQQFMEGKSILAAAAELDPSVAYIVNPQKAIRDVLSVTMPAAWMRTEIEAQEMAASMQEQQDVAQALALANQGADAAGKLAGIAAQQGEQVAI